VTTACSGKTWIVPSSSTFTTWQSSRVGNRRLSDLCWAAVSLRMQLHGPATDRHRDAASSSRVPPVHHRRLARGLAALDRRHPPDEPPALFHMMLGYGVVRALLLLVCALGRLGHSREFARHSQHSSPPVRLDQLRRPVRRCATAPLTRESCRSFTLRARQRTVWRRGSTRMWSPRVRPTFEHLALDPGHPEAGHRCIGVVRGDLVEAVVTTSSAVPARMAA
jgi:hypothetical protein